MLITLAAVGRLKAGPETELAHHYVKRFNGVGRNLGFGGVAVVELAESRAATAALRQQDEAQRLLQRTPEKALVWALDEKGHALTSSAFASELGRRRDDGAGDLVLMIGGPDGHAAAAREKADLVVSLSAMTLPHGLARVVLLEQLYRAATILAGHPYHRA